MASVNVRVAEGCTPDATLGWDTVWDAAAGVGDWAVAGPAETGNVGGLQATAAIATAVVLCLFSDVRCPAGHPLAHLVEDGDLRGWWGDAINVRADLGERPLGSLLWLLERAPLILPDMTRWAEAMALDALQGLVDQGACARVTAAATADPARNRLDLTVALYGRDGATAFKQTFAKIWAQVGRS